MSRGGVRVGKDGRWSKLSLGLFLWVVGWFVALGVACDEGNAIVGGECAFGYSVCGDRCVRLSDDPMHCGACHRACGPSEICDDGVCGDGDGGSDASLTDGPLGEGSTSDGLGTDGGGDGGDGGGGDGAPVCVPPYDTAAQCGDCFTRCTAPNDACRLGDAGGFVCAPLCAPPLTNCGGVCVDTDSDPDHCGRCNNVCASSICQMGVCQGATTGDIIYIGHDYMVAPNGTSQTQVLSRSVLIPPRNPVRILVYTRYANPTAVARVNGVLGAIPSQFGRTVTVASTTSDTDVPTRLAAGDFDVLVVHDQVSAPAGAPATLGASWATTLADFTHEGGVFVVLDGAAGTTKEMPQFVTATGLLSVTAHTPIADGSLLDVVAPFDAIGTGVVTPYAARSNTVNLDSEANGGRVVWVVTETSTSKPNVIHKSAL